MPHEHSHAFADWQARVPEGLVLHNRRNLLKASIAGVAGLSLPTLLRSHAAAAAGQSTPRRKSVILLWMAGGPSHIDTWDPKPTRPLENRGPFSVIDTKLPGVRICEHLPKQAAMLDRFTIIRSVDCRSSNHEPCRVMQSGHRDTDPRTNPKADTYPAIGSVVAKYCAGRSREMPAYVAFQKSPSHIAYAGHLGKQYDPFIANQAAKLPIYSVIGEDSGRMSRSELFQFAAGLTHERIHNRRALLKDFDRLRSDLDQNGSLAALDSYSRQAVDLVTGRKAQEAFNLEQESQATRDRYGKHLWCQQALLARRLVEAGSSFVTLDLSYHPASGTWDTHGDNIPPYGGIKKGLGPLLPLFDHLLTTLVDDLAQRGLLDDVLVIAMGEFGRTPMMGTQDSTDGRNHWPVVMSMSLAGGGLRHGQVIGATEHDGGQVKHRPVTPGDLAATIYQFMGVPLDATYLDPQGRPNHVVVNGQPIRELWG